MSFDGADVNGREKDVGSTAPLWHAASEGHVDTVKFLLRQRVRVNAFNVPHLSFKLRRMATLRWSSCCSGQCRCVIGWSADLETPSSRL